VAQLTHCEISGVTDNKFPNDQTCLDHIRNLFDKLGATETAGFNRVASALPKLKQEDIYGIMPADRAKPYDMLEVIKRLVMILSLMNLKPFTVKQFYVDLHALMDGLLVLLPINVKCKNKKRRNANGGRNLFRLSR
jgi:hypothetical protein